MGGNSMSTKQNAPEGEELTWDQVGPLIEELKGIANAMLLRRGDFRLASPSSLVLTALRRQKRADQEFCEVTWPNRRYFFGAAYRAMERALIDRARQRDRIRQIQTVSLGDLQIDEPMSAVEEHPEQVEALLQALCELEQTHPDLAELVRYRLYGRLTFAQAAELMDINERTARRYWERAELVLKAEVLKKLNE
jgi:DNA-directed RNA polymerase specialized sigma24 family protein